MLVSPEVKDRILNLLSQNRKIEAIKVVCDATNCGLKEGKDYIDSLQSGDTQVIYADVDTQIITLLNNGEKLEAVKLYKEYSGLGLAESKDYVDNLREKGKLTGDGRTVFNNRDTQIDKILAEQNLKPGQRVVLTSVSYGTSPVKILLLILAVIIVAGILIATFIMY